MVLTRLRVAWRSARSVPGVTNLLSWVDRLWWARVIRNADIVDIDLVRMQLGRRASARQAVRQYVRGGFSRGLVLNPLFSDGIVSKQLPDNDRVPALYAYLVNDPAEVATNLAWDAVEYGRSHPKSISAAGGPVGHAWRGARAGRSLRFGTTGSARAAQATDVLNAYVEAFSDEAPQAATPSVPRPVPVIIEWEADCADEDGEALRQAIKALIEVDGAMLLSTSSATRTIRAQVALLPLSSDRIILCRVRDVGGPEALADAGTIIVSRKEGALTSSDALLRVIAGAHDAPTAPLWLNEDGTIASAGTAVRDGRKYRLLTGHPYEDAEALGDAVPSAFLDAPITAVSLGENGRARTLTGATTIARWTPPETSAPTARAYLAPALWRFRGLSLNRWSSDGPEYRRMSQSFTLPSGESVPRLRWAIKTSAPAGATSESWGDTHFARALARALERAGQYAAVDALPAAKRLTSALDDVVLVLRGPHRVDAPPAEQRLLWIISHPDEVTASEIEGFDCVFAASERWAEVASSRFGSHIRPLLQCTDPGRFHPVGLPRSADLAFVGTARGIARPSVIVPIRAGAQVSVYGPDWRGYIPASAVAGTHVANAALPALYESAGAVLNDHWPAMKREGFVSNRLFDVIACGGRAISDEVDGIDELFGGAVRTYASAEDLRELVSRPLDGIFPSDPELEAISHRVREQHSFDNRARQLLDAVLA